MNETKQKLTAYQITEYQIKVPGYISENWSDWVEGITMTTENENTDRPTTILTGTLDQAALQRLLRRLYALGVPLLSVMCTDCY